ncbi:cyclopropane-fatty-acyl-phospholipid synthase [Ferrimonas sediminum]|uniref:Cyclopropane-fatty-acyl-phospholipid synthase n=1 Tax=Ferrimonas sediminum TaxID=718193 RepID=A0A1G8VK55_9GAMM|nr:cyclopropane-fatty-acyl-phospholipid synthase family protein [Ferrimonas sediminum]SDJ66339.1 cyclopropane-fatty-acyl-phospholipid synthase [Ferrimonas sediminum]
MDKTLTRVSPNWLDTTAKRTLFALLPRLRGGCLVIQDQQEHQFGDANSPLKGVIRIHHPRAYRQILLGGSIGAGEGFIQGHWSSPDLVAVVQVMARNLKVLEALESRLSWITKVSNLLTHRRNHNSKAGSKRNIVAHYDLGNDLYQTFLDKQMVYSSAIYPHDGASLEQAQTHKLELICQRLQLKPGETLLEIGTGWGALAIHAARHYQVQVTTTTISDAQYEYARQRVEQEGLSERITLLKQDYRELQGRYDKLVSIEMIEAVGHEYLSTFFSTCRARLHEHGRMLIQAITINDQRYDAYRRGVDFIQRYIFPGGCLPSIERLSRHIATDTDMVISALHDIGQDYGRTLKHWHQRFNQSLPQIRNLGYQEDFIRMWQFYLGYCEGAFYERSISTVHLVANRPLYRGRP